MVAVLEDCTAAAWREAHGPEHKEADDDGEDRRQSKHKGWHRHDRLLAVRASHGRRQSGDHRLGAVSDDHGLVVLLEFCFEFVFGLESNATNKQTNTKKNAM